MLGDTAVAVHPDDERYKHLIGRNAVLPLVGRRIPIIADDYADPEKGTGAVKITPAHDFNDFEVGQRHHLPMINVLDTEARLDLDGNIDVPRRRAGRRRSSTRPWRCTASIASRRARRSSSASKPPGLLDKIEPHTHMVPHGDRSGVVIEPFLTDQWYVDAKDAGAPGDRGGARRPHRVRAEELGEDLFRLDGEHPALVHLAPAVVGPPDSGLVRAGRQGVRRRDRGRGGVARARLLRRDRGDHADAGPRHGARSGRAARRS